MFEILCNKNEVGSVGSSLEGSQARVLLLNTANRLRVHCVQGGPLIQFAALYRRQEKQWWGKRRLNRQTVPAAATVINGHVHGRVCCEVLCFN